MHHKEVTQNTKGSQRQRESVSGREKGREKEKKKTGRSYAETYTYRELTEKLKGQNPGGETQRGTET